MSQGAEELTVGRVAAVVGRRRAVTVEEEQGPAAGARLTAPRGRGARCGGPSPELSRHFVEAPSRRPGAAFTAGGNHDFVRGRSGTA